MSSASRLESRSFAPLPRYAASFVATTTAVRNTSTDIDSLSDQITQNSTPTIETLASIRGLALKVVFELWRYVQPGAARSSLADSLDTSLRGLDDDVRNYLELPRFSGEQRHWSEVQQAWARFDAAVRQERDLAERGHGDEARRAFQRVEASSSQLMDAAMAAIQFNARNGREIAARIKETRLRAQALSNALTALGVMLALAGALVMERESKKRRAVEQAYARQVEARADELEQFAGRVAHDIRSPIAAAQMGADLIRARTADTDLRDLGERIVHTLGRTEAVIAGLLDFARSGAAPDPGARTDVRAAVADLASEIAHDAERARVQICCEPAPNVLVACNPGVYASLLGNLVRNAIRYMGGASIRRITISVIDQGATVRTEVADTGPGIMDENLPYLFVPYFRGHASGKDGLGLGLATVKRLAEGHRGEAGVRSKPGQGSTFWFVLPRAGTAPESIADESTADLPLRH